MKEKILAFIKNNQWWLVALSIMATFYWVKDYTSSEIINYQQTQIDRYQQAYLDKCK